MTNATVPRRTAADYQRARDELAAARTRASQQKSWTDTTKQKSHTLIERFKASRAERRQEQMRVHRQTNWHWSFDPILTKVIVIIAVIGWILLWLWAFVWNGWATQLFFSGTSVGISTSRGTIALVLTTVGLILAIVAVIWIKRNSNGYIRSSTQKDEVTTTPIPQAPKEGSNVEHR